MVTLPIPQTYWRVSGDDDSSWILDDNNIFTPTAGVAVEVVTVGASPIARIIADTTPMISGLTDLSAGYNTEVIINISTKTSGSNLVYSLVGPSWLSINANTGQITGTTPSANVETSATVTVRNSTGSASDVFSISVVADPWIASIDSGSVYIQISGANAIITVSDTPYLEWNTTFTVPTSQILEGKPIVLVPQTFSVIEKTYSVDRPALVVSPESDIPLITYKWLVNNVSKKEGTSYTLAISDTGYRLDCVVMLQNSKGLVNSTVVAKPEIAYSHSSVKFNGANSNRLLVSNAGNNPDILLLTYSITVPSDEDINMHYLLSLPAPRYTSCAVYNKKPYNTFYYDNGSLFDFNSIKPSVDISGKTYSMVFMSQRGGLAQVRNFINDGTILYGSKTMTSGLQIETSGTMGIGGAYAGVYNTSNVIHHRFAKWSLSAITDPNFDEICNLLINPATALPRNPTLSVEYIGQPMYDFRSNADGYLAGTNLGTLGSGTFATGGTPPYVQDVIV